MKVTLRAWSGGLAIILASFASGSQCAFAQITPDSTLPVFSLVNQIGSTYEITGGTTVNTNLFHSFRDFSVPTNAAAFFRNATGIQNILTRITGNSISNIDGLIKANGTANLFLINPNGIIFGRNAKLEIGGSFLASTAKSVLFNDGAEFSTSPSPQSTSPLLLVGVPLGLQFGSNSSNNGQIIAQGDGHGLSYDLTTFAIVRPQDRDGLAVQNGQTLALVGGDITLEGANLIAADGRIELGSVVGNGIVGIASTNNGWTLNYDNITQFGNIHLEQAAAADTSGSSSGGNIQAQGRQVSLTDGSVFSASPLGSGNGGEIFVHATDLFTARGAALDPILQLNLFGSGLITDVSANATGRGSNVRVVTGRLELTDGGQISASTAGTGNAGDVQVNASAIVLRGGGDIGSSGLFSSVLNPTVAGNGGNIIVTADSLQVSDGAQILANTFGIGNAGNLDITAQTINLVGAPEVFTEFSAAVQLGATGDGGRLRITTDSLAVANGAQIAVSTGGSGTAGSLLVSAKSIELAGQNERVRSGLFASAIFSSGVGGDIVVNSDRLVVRDGAVVSASNFASNNRIPPGTGPVGNINITSPLILLNSGQITASSAGGDRGNINLISSLISLRNGSNISTNAQGDATGGNITINTDFLVAVPTENSDITANAANNFGGRNIITAKGVLGFQTDNREATDFSDITATSALGAQFDGVVEIRSPDAELSGLLVELPSKFTDPNSQIVAACARFRGNELIVTGRGGIQADAIQPPSSQSIWRDLRLAEIPSTQAIAPTQPEANIVTKPPASQQNKPQALPMVEAKGWETGKDGNLRLIASVPQPSSALAWHLPSLCSTK